MHGSILFLCSIKIHWQAFSRFPGLCFYSFLACVSAVSWPLFFPWFHGHYFHSFLILFAWFPILVPTVSWPPWFHGLYFHGFLAFISMASWHYSHGFLTIVSMVSQPLFPMVSWTLFPCLTKTWTNSQCNIHNGWSCKTVPVSWAVIDRRFHGILLM